MDGVQASQLLQIEHHGYEKIEWAAEKKARYESQDIDKLEWQLGSSDGYKHLTDESKLELLPYSAKTLSVVMLAKNEWFEVIRQIRQWQTYADQVVVIDTGSIDGTDMMCEVLGVEVHRYECCPGYKDETHMLCDFAKARNFGISKATGDYIFMVDPDEELASREAYTFSKLMIRGKAGYSCEIHNYRPRPGMEPVIQRTYQPRLFENAHGVFYEARVHETLEQFFLQHPELDIDLADGILIRHYGFLKTTGEAREIKNAKYAVLLTEILKENPTDAKALFALGCQMNSVGEYDKGDELLAQAIKYEPTFVLAKWELAQRMATRALDLVKTLEGTYAPDPFFANKVKEFHHDMVKWERH